MIGTIRPVEIRTVNVEAHSLADVHTVLERQRPDGFELTDAPVRMSNGTTALTATGVFARRDGTREIEGADMPALRGQVPDGWALVSVRQA
ncbi:hypothetical protein [Microbacterium sp. Leaf436]|uniref:hypothetical protein n=1 Tax=Microbacterium sp. Leaf436 TaxID=1736377 RepID=UPI0006F94389|nr:hypothetical protein [Microbacterium sp. Leaf436]KQT75419.1 hypothetical protein ASG45_02650 [Microbacterium sp. Leaf436]